MPDYQYKAVDAHGAAVHGSIAASGELELEQHLQTLGYWLIDAKELSQSQARTSDKPIARKELIDFFNALESLLMAGISIAQALNAIAEETENENFSAILIDLKINIEAGNALDVCMARYPKAFNGQIINLIKAGEYSGNLAQSCHDIASHIEWLDGILADIKQASIYPSLVLAAVMGLLFIMFVVVVPKFNSLFVSLNLELPLLTQVVVNVGNFSRDFWPILLLGPFLFVCGVVYLPRYIPSLKLLLDRIKLQLPILGGLNSMIVQSRFCHNLALLLKAGVPILESLKLCRNLVGNQVMVLAISESEIAVNEGRRMTEVLRQHKIISPIILTMIIVGEETGRLDEALKHASLRFDKELPRKIKQFFGILEPMIMLFLIVVVGLVGGAVFLPMFSLMSGL